MSKSYYEILISNVSRKDEDVLTSQLFELGAEGVSEDLSFTQKEDTYEPITLLSERFALKAYFLTMPDLDVLQLIISQFDGVKWDLSKHQEKDWLAEWKKGFKAFKLVNDIWVVPSWLEKPTEAHSAIFIDPGMAFGTGTHETTQLAAYLIAKIKNNHFNSFLDVGTGSGILAILAEIVGFKKINATEIDEVAREVAKENILKNQTKYIEILSYQVEDLTHQFDVVVANIIDGVLVQIQTHLKKCCMSGSYLILTGILEERKSIFLENFDFEDFEIIEWKKQGEWLGLLAQKR